MCNNLLFLLLIGLVLWFPCVKSVEIVENYDSCNNIIIVGKETTIKDVSDCQITLKFEEGLASRLNIVECHNIKIVFTGYYKKIEDFAFFSATSSEINIENINISTNVSASFIESKIYFNVWENFGSLNYLSSITRGTIKHCLEVIFERSHILELNVSFVNTFTFSNSVFELFFLNISHTSQVFFYNVDFQTSNFYLIYVKEVEYNSITLSNFIQSDLKTAFITTIINSTTIEGEIRLINDCDQKIRSITVTKSYIQDLSLFCSVLELTFDGTPFTSLNFEKPVELFRFSNAKLRQLNNMISYHSIQDFEIDNVKFHNARFTFDPILGIMINNVIISNSEFKDIKLFQPLNPPTGMLTFENTTFNNVASKQGGFIISSFQNSEIYFQNVTLNHADVMFSSFVVLYFNMVDWNNSEITEDMYIQQMTNCYFKNLWIFKSFHNVDNYNVFFDGVSFFGELKFKMFNLVSFYSVGFHHSIEVTLMKAFYIENLRISSSTIVSNIPLFIVPVQNSVEGVIVKNMSIMGCEFHSIFEFNSDPTATSLRNKHVNLVLHHVIIRNTGLVYGILLKHKQFEVDILDSELQMPTVILSEGSLRTLRVAINSSNIFCSTFSITQKASLEVIIYENVHFHRPPSDHFSILFLGSLASFDIYEPFSIDNYHNFASFNTLTITNRTTKNWFPDIYIESATCSLRNVQYGVNCICQNLILSNSIGNFSCFSEHVCVDQYRIAAPPQIESVFIESIYPVKVHKGENTWQISFSMRKKMDKHSIIPIYYLIDGKLLPYNIEFDKFDDLSSGKLMLNNTEMVHNYTVSVFYPFQMMRSQLQIALPSCLPGKYFSVDKCVGCPVNTRQFNPNYSGSSCMIDSLSVNAKHPFVAARMSGPYYDLMKGEFIVERPESGTAYLIKGNTFCTGGKVMPLLSGQTTNTLNPITRNAYTSQGIVVEDYNGCSTLRRGQGCLRCQMMYHSLLVSYDAIRGGCAVLLPRNWIIIALCCQIVILLILTRLYSRGHLVPWCKILNIKSNTTLDYDVWEAIRLLKDLFLLTLPLLYSTNKDFFFSLDDDNFLFVFLKTVFNPFITISYITRVTTMAFTDMNQIILIFDLMIMMLTLLPYGIYGIRNVFSKKMVFIEKYHQITVSLFFVFLPLMLKDLFNFLTFVRARDLINDSIFSDAIYTPYDYDFEMTTPRRFLLSGVLMLMLLFGSLLIYRSLKQRIGFKRNLKRSYFLIMICVGIGTYCPEFISILLITIMAFFFISKPFVFPVLNTISLIYLTILLTIVNLLHLDFSTIYMFVRYIYGLIFFSGVVIYSLIKSKGFKQLNDEFENGFQGSETLIAP
ncbi:hypothetical protein PCE1_001936 [Barthelona sp. PCE]